MLGSSWDSSRSGEPSVGSYLAPSAYVDDEIEAQTIETYEAPAPSAPPQPQLVFRPGADGQLQLVSP